MAKLIEWRDSFEIGITSIDFEHRSMIDLINELYEEIEPNQSNKDEKVEAFLGEVFAKISAHFALEEREMRSRSYPGFSDHKEDHERLLDGIRDIMDDFESGVYSAMVQQLQGHLNSWFSVHFGSKDRDLHRFLGH